MVKGFTRSRELAELQELKQKAEDIRRGLERKPFNRPELEISCEGAKVRAAELAIWLEEMVFIAEDEYCK